MYVCRYMMVHLIYVSPLFPPPLNTRKKCAVDCFCMFRLQHNIHAAMKTSLLLCRHTPNAIWAILLCVHCTQKRSQIQSDQGEWHRRLFIFIISVFFVLFLAAFFLHLYIYFTLKPYSSDSLLIHMFWFKSEIGTHEYTHTHSQHAPLNSEMTFICMKTKF